MTVCAIGNRPNGSLSAPLFQAAWARSSSRAEYACRAKAASAAFECGQNFGGQRRVEIRRALKQVEQTGKQLSLADGEGHGTGRLVLVMKPMPTRVTADGLGLKSLDNFLQHRLHAFRGLMQPRIVDRLHRRYGVDGSDLDLRAADVLHHDVAG